MVGQLIAARTYLRGYVCRQMLSSLQSGAISDSITKGASHLLASLDLDLTVLNICPFCDERVTLTWCAGVTSDVDASGARTIWSVVWIWWAGGDHCFAVSRWVHPFIGSSV
jgi:hypothetical protein